MLISLFLKRYAQEALQTWQKLKLFGLPVMNVKLQKDRKNTLRESMRFVFQEDLASAGLKEK